MITFNVHHILAQYSAYMEARSSNANSWDRIAALVKHSLPGFNNYNVTTEELMGCYIAISQIQFLNEDDAALFRLTYSESWGAELIANDQFRAGHEVMYIGG